MNGFWEFVHAVLLIFLAALFLGISAGLIWWLLPSWRRKRRNRGE